ncbi:MAG: type II toxin-antitoxin system HicA family toxin [bacterium]|nr:type II toxin-antitoxin system HicA family toxin [bacterium]
MTKLPSISSRKCIRALAKVGFYFVRQKGSHIILRRDEPFAQVVVPQRKTLPPGTLRNIIDGAGLTDDEFMALL